MVGRCYVDASHHQHNDNKKKETRVRVYTSGPRKGDPHGSGKHEQGSRKGRKWAVVFAKGSPGIGKRLKVLQTGVNQFTVLEEIARH